MIITLFHSFMVRLFDGSIARWFSRFFASQKNDNNNETMKPSNNRIILIFFAFFFLIRLIGITNSPLEIGHNWRQCLTNMVARNFLEIDANIFFPRIDIAGEKTGIMGAEFPLFNYLIYLASWLFGETHWHGRWINLIVSTAGIYYYFLLVKELFNKKIAAYATIILTVSVWFDFSRKIMPDTFSVALVLIGFYYGFCYLKKGNFWRLALFFALITLGILSKLSALSLMSFLLIPLLIPQIKIGRKIAMTLAAALCVTLVGAWYFYWVPHLAEAYGYMLYFPRSLAEGAAEIAVLWQLTLEKFYFSAFHSYVAFACFLVGLFVLFFNNFWTRNKIENSRSVSSSPQPPPKGETNASSSSLREESPPLEGAGGWKNGKAHFFNLINDKKIFYLKIGIITFALIFFLFMLKTGEVFPLHNYYIIPAVPLMALVAALFLANLKPKYALIILTVITIEGIANQYHEFFIKKNERYKLTLESIADKITQADDLIIINDGSRNPQQMYFAHRKGWTINQEDLNPAHIAQMQTLGASYLFVNKNLSQQKFEYKTVYEDKHYIIYKL